MNGRYICPHFLSYFYLQDYASILAQAVYATFCESFPDSYRQFDVDFKEDLISLVSQWVVGEYS
jgi:hypothetical protein